MPVYNNGKFKRLNLMFVVNGGAFAIAKLLFENNETFIGKLTLLHVSISAIIFTIVMIRDTLNWNDRMRREFLGSLAPTHEGKIALPVLGVLIIIAWILVGWPS